jgi:hypothetical protein
MAHSQLDPDRANREGSRVGGTRGEFNHPVSRLPLRVRLGKSRREQNESACPQVADASFDCTGWGHFQTHAAAAQQTVGLLNHLVGKREQLIRHTEPKRFGRLEVEHKLKLVRLLDRQIRDLRALENPANVVACLAIHHSEIGAVAHQASDQSQLPGKVDRGHRMSGGDTTI